MKTTFNSAAVFNFSLRLGLKLLLYCRYSDSIPLFFSLMIRLKCFVQQACSVASVVLKFFVMFLLLLLKTNSGY